MNSISTQPTFEDLVKYSNVAPKDIGGIFDPANPNYDKQFPKCLLVDPKMLVEHMDRWPPKYGVSEKNTAEIIGTSTEVLRCMSSPKTREPFTADYDVEYLKKYVREAKTFLGGCNPDPTTIARAFGNNALLYRIVSNQHGNKRSNGSTDFDGLLKEYLQQSVSAEHEIHDPLGTIGDPCRNIQEVRQILLNPKTQDRLLSASVDLRFNAHTDWVTVRLIGVARFYAQTGVPPYCFNLLWDI